MKDESIINSSSTSRYRTGEDQPGRLQILSALHATAAVDFCDTYESVPLYIDNHLALSIEQLQETQFRFFACTLLARRHSDNVETKGR